MQPYDPPMTPFLEVIHADSSIVIINKQSGLLTVPGRGENKKDCLLSRVQTEFPSALTVHRLDMQTSGLVIFALNKGAQSTLGRLFEARQIHKRYCAWIAGCPLENSGVIDLPISADWPNRPRQKIDFDVGKPSTTRWEVIERKNDRSYVLLYPLTGRSHQLRIHLQEIGHPILGDPLYGNDVNRQMASRLLLHADYLNFNHPETNEEFEITAPPNFSGLMCEQE